jgi:thioesterase DpgC
MKFESDTFCFSLQPWISQLPVFGIGFESDADAMSCFIAAGESRLAELGPKPGRTCEQHLLAREIHRVSRECRAGFMRFYADRVYNAITKPLECHRHLSELAFSASELFPGLTPTRQQIAQEREHIQAHKEGREIDQGIFFHALLARADIGLRVTESLLQPTAKALSLFPEFQRRGRTTLGAVHLERRGTTAFITVCNTASLNAEDDELIDNMETAVDIALLDDSVKVGVLRGGEMSHPRYAGKRVFSAGINLKHLHRGQISFVDFVLRREFGYINKMARGLILRRADATTPARVNEIPWIAAVDTFAIGGGAQIVLVCDRVIGSSDSYFSLPAAQEGIIPGVANLRLGPVAGGRLARQILLYGRKVWANEEDGRLLFDEVVAPGDMDAAIADCAARLDSPAVIANRRMLRLAEEPLDLFRSYMAEFALSQAARMYSDDVLEKVKQA